MNTATQQHDDKAQAALDSALLGIKYWTGIVRRSLMKPKDVKAYIMIESNTIRVKRHVLGLS